MNRLLHAGFDMTDDDITLTELGEYELPFGRRVRLIGVDYRNGLHMLRMIWREGKRITQVEVDADSANELGSNILQWAKAHSNAPEN